MVETEEEKSLVEKLYNTYEQKMYFVAYSVLQNVQDAESAPKNARVNASKSSEAESYNR